MRIAVWHNLPSGGGKRALYHHVKGLHKRGHQFEFWHPSTASEGFLSLEAFGRVHQLKYPDDAHRGKSTAIRNYRRRLENLRRMDAHCRQAASEINGGNFDVLFANSCMFFRVTPIARYAQLPSVIYLGEPFRALYEAMPELPWSALPDDSPWRNPKEWVADYLRTRALRIQVREERAGAAQFDRILVNSLYSRESVLRAYGLESKVCYLGVDAELFRPNGAEKEGFVLGLGGVAPGKRIDRSIRAIAAIPETERPALFWVGNFASEKYKSEMETLAETLGVRIIFYINIEDSEVVDLMNRASVFLYTPHLEPFGFAPLEANACGTPVVAIAEGGIRETVVDGLNGFLVPDDNPEAIGEKIVNLLSDRKSAAEIGAACREYVLTNWTWDNAIDRIEQHFKEIPELLSPVF